MQAGSIIPTHSIIKYVISHVHSILKFSFAVSYSIISQKLYKMYMVSFFMCKKTEAQRHYVPNDKVSKPVSGGYGLEAWSPFTKSSVLFSTSGLFTSDPEGTQYHPRNNRTAEGMKTTSLTLNKLQFCCMTRVTSLGNNIK